MHQATCALGQAVEFVHDVGVLAGIATEAAGFAFDGELHGWI